MMNHQQMMDTIEERFVGWPLDSKICVILMALSSYAKVPPEIQEQERKLNALVAKADAWQRVREALHHLTVSEIRVTITGQAGEVNLPPGAGARDLGPEHGATVVALLAELSKIEKEFADARVDYALILRFLRHN